jgi:hypothetical protein
MTHTGLAVLEARWWEEGNHSVRPLFETLAAIAVDNPYSFRYDMFADQSSLGCIMQEIGSDRQFHSIYVASHGDANSIQGLPGQAISRAAFRNRLRGANPRHTVTGLYLGSCLVCNRNNAEFFLDQDDGCNINWVAGYSKNVDWMDSSSVDMVFWSKFLQKRATNRRRKRHKHSDLRVARDAANAVKSLMPTVFDQLGFNMYYREGAGAIQQVW